MNIKILFPISILYAIAMSTVAFIIPDNEMLRNIYCLTQFIAAVILIFLGIEDNNTLKVSWKNTAVYLFVILPGLICGCTSGILLEQLIFYLPGIAFVIVMTIYSFKTGRGGADRDIGLLSILAFPQTAVLALIPALLISVFATAKLKRKYPMLFPYSIIFGLLTLAQFSMLITKVMI